MIKHIVVNTLYSFKMNNGEEIIGRVIRKDNDDNCVELEQAFAIGMGQQGPQLIPALFTGVPKSTVWLNINNVSVCGKAATDMEDVYREVTTGIKTPDKKIIMG